MAVADNIAVAHGDVGESQDQLGNTENALDPVEQAAVEGKRTGGCFRGLFRLLLLVALVAAVVVAIKKILGCRSSGAVPVIEETIVDEVVVDEDGNVIEETVVEDVAVTVDGEAVDEAVIIASTDDANDS